MALRIGCLWGPPGSGKTMFAGALAKTCGVPLIYGSVSVWQMAGKAGVIVVSACNNPEQLDPAIRRPGRLGQHFELTLPDDHGRRAILKYHSGIDLDPNYVEQFTVAMGSDQPSSCDGGA